MRIEMKCVCGRSVAFEGDAVDLPGDGVVHYDVEVMAEHWAEKHKLCSGPAHRQDGYQPRPQIGTPIDPPRTL